MPKRTLAALLALLVAASTLAVVAQPAAAHSQTTTKQRCSYDPFAGRQCWTETVTVAHTHSCGAGMTGTYPNCYPIPPANQNCGAGTTGTYPDCYPIPPDNKNSDDSDDDGGTGTNNNNGDGDDGDGDDDSDDDSDDDGGTGTNNNDDSDDDGGTGTTNNNGDGDDDGDDDGDGDDDSGDDDSDDDGGTGTTNNNGDSDDDGGTGTNNNNGDGDDDSGDDDSDGGGGTGTNNNNGDSDGGGGTGTNNNNGDSDGGGGTGTNNNNGGSKDPCGDYADDLIDALNRPNTDGTYNLPAEPATCRGSSTRELLRRVRVFGDDAERWFREAFTWAMENQAESSENQGEMFDGTDELLEEIAKLWDDVPNPAKAAALGVGCLLLMPAEEAASVTPAGPGATALYTAVCAAALAHLSDIVVNYDASDGADSEAADSEGDDDSYDPDADGDGKISTAELNEVLRKHAAGEVTDEERDRAKAQYKCGIGLKSYCTSSSQNSGGSAAPDYDADGDGKISDAERQKAQNDWKSGKLDGDAYERINNLWLCSIGIPVHGVC